MICRKKILHIKDLKYFRSFILNREKQIIEVITTASGTPDEMKKMYVDAFKKIGFSHVDFIDIGNKHEARNIDFCERVEKAHAVFFSGGDQFKLSAILGGTETVGVIKEKYVNEKNFVVAGTSAGAISIHSHLTNVIVICLEFDVLNTLNVHPEIFCCAYM